MFLQAEMKIWRVGDEENFCLGDKKPRFNRFQALGKKRHFCTNFRWSLLLARLRFQSRHTLQLVQWIDEPKGLMLKAIYHFNDWGNPMLTNQFPKNGCNVLNDLIFYPLCSRN